MPDIEMVAAATTNAAMVADLNTDFIDISYNGFGILPCVRRPLHFLAINPETHDACNVLVAASCAILVEYVVVDPFLYGRQSASFIRWRRNVLQPLIANGNCARR
jgi:hypothetical protein